VKQALREPTETIFVQGGTNWGMWNYSCEYRATEDKMFGFALTFHIDWCSS